MSIRCGQAGRVKSSTQHDNPGKGEQGMHHNNDGDDQRLDLRLEVSEPRPLSSERQARWAGLLSALAGAPSAPSIIFLGELLETLDPGEMCAFTCDAGTADWRLSTRRLSLSRQQARGAGPSGSILVATYGFPHGMALEWDGRLDGPFPMEVLARGITIAQEECLLSLAHDLFARASHDRFITPGLFTGDFWGEEQEFHHE